MCWLWSLESAEWAAVYLVCSWCMSSHWVSLMILLCCVDSIPTDTSAELRDLLHKLLQRNASNRIDFGMCRHAHSDMLSSDSCSQTSYCIHWWLRFFIWSFASTAYWWSQIGIDNFWSFLMSSNYMPTAISGWSSDM